MYRVAYSWTHDSHLACDLVQETIARCLKHSAIFRNNDDVRIWLYKVLKNCWRDHLRSKRHQHSDITDFELESDSNPETEHYRYQVIVQLQNAFRKMTSEHREIISLVVIEGFSYEDVAQILEIPTGTVMSRVSRARESLRKLLKQVNYPDTKNSPAMWRVK